jgi:phosphopantothenoylcysteine decarboxylase/phosphopantothenate--cysteine ligase
MFKRIVICSGPTVEPIDPVRFLSNRSSGKSGLQLANEALKRGIPDIILISGPTCLDMANAGFTVIRVETALEMREQLQQYSDDADVIIMAAAVSDYRPVHYSKEKIKKNQETLTIQLLKNPDLLFELGQRKKPGQILVGYAAETHDIFKNAREKFQRKNLDLLILNEVSAENPAFHVDTNQVYFVTGNGFQKQEMMEKSCLAVRVWDEIEKLVHRLH